MSDSELLEYLKRVSVSASGKTSQAEKSGVLEAGIEQVIAVLESRKPS